LTPGGLLSVKVRGQVSQPYKRSGLVISFWKGGWRKTPETKKKNPEFF